ncbi:uncharacterized protein LOC116843515 [Odontomachus brunneus]|uniref:uncharacterized protein LOC116843515 n=1 Tax=Odontomachus brunneus TaxID=486640 RepID=UPI0013F26BBD|nr:uncharacterized protein LOC116843515 [Odontomachus brunneus]
MTDDWSDRANNNEGGMRVMAYKAKISDRITNTLIILHTMSVVTYCTGMIIAEVDITDQTIEVPYINKLDFPFTINTQPMYRFVLIAEYVHMILSNWGAGLSNIILMTMAIGSPDATEQIVKSILFYTITNLEAFVFCFAGEYLNNKSKAIGYAAYDCTWYNLKSKDSRILLFIILRSQKQLTLTAGKMMDLTLESFANAIGTPDATEQIVKSILFYMSTNLEAFIFCFAGEYLNNKSKAIGLAAYNCAWYNLNPKESRILLFIILRSQKELTLTAGKMMDLTLQTFASIMNASGSYLSVLLAAQ